MNLTRYQRSLVAPPQPLAKPLRRRQFSNELLIEKFDQYLLMLDYSKLTREGYGRTLCEFAALLGDRNLVTATKRDVRAFLAKLFERGLCSASINHALHALRAAWRFFGLGDQVFDSPPHYIQSRKEPKRLPPVKRLDEIEKVINAAEHPRDKAMLELLYAGGLRPCEIVALRVEDLNLESRPVPTLTVRQSKDGDRVVPFGRAAANLLRKYLGERREGVVFRQKCTGWRRRSEPPKGLTTRSVGRIVRDCAKRAGVSNMFPYVFRHSCMTHLLDGGADLRFIADFAGHSNVSVTTKYLHTATTRLKKVHSLLEREEL